VSTFNHFDDIDLSFCCCSPFDKIDELSFRIKNCSIYNNNNNRDVTPVVVIDKAFQTSSVTVSSNSTLMSPPKRTTTTTDPHKDHLDERFLQFGNIFVYTEEKQNNEQQQQQQQQLIVSSENDFKTIFLRNIPTDKKVKLKWPLKLSSCGDEFSVVVVDLLLNVTGLLVRNNNNNNNCEVELDLDVRVSLRFYNNLVTARVAEAVVVDNNNNRVVYVQVLSIFIIFCIFIIHIKFRLYTKHKIIHIKQI
jgi:hypothetical protein